MKKIFLIFALICVAGIATAQNYGITVGGGEVFKQDVSGTNANIMIEEGGVFEGDISLSSGIVHVGKNAVLNGNISASKLSLWLDENAVINGDVSIAAGKIVFSPGAVIEGNVSGAFTNVDMSRGGVIKGDLNLALGKTAIPNSSVTGSRNVMAGNFNIAPLLSFFTSGKAPSKQTTIFSFLVFHLIMLAILLGISALFKKLTDKACTCLTENAFMAIGVFVLVFFGALVCALLPLLVLFIAGFAGALLFIIIYALAVMLLALLSAATALKAVYKILRNKNAIKKNLGDMQAVLVGYAVLILPFVLLKLLALSIPAAAGTLGAFASLFKLIIAAFIFTSAGAVAYTLTSKK